MATKKDGIPCYDKAADEEPLFVLRAQDMLAPEMVREWAYRAKVMGTPIEKIDEARRCADQMEDWQISLAGKRKVAD
jgi:hypothetical protein